MKYQLLLLISSLTFFGCKNDKKYTNSSDKNLINIEKAGEPIQFVCDNFFDKGDYSSVCFVSSKMPIVKRDEIPVPSICIYRVGKRPNTSNDDFVSVNFQKITSTSLASPVFKGLKKDAKGIVTEINGLGDQAYITTYLTQDKYKEKDIVVLYKNLIITFHVIYEKTNSAPCSYDSSELQKFADIVIQNL